MKCARFRCCIPLWVLPLNKIMMLLRYLYFTQKYLEESELPLHVAEQLGTIKSILIVLGGHVAK
ncbi:unnamed protein product [Amoebophrya sp. A25]|nr:unnamed protein product [Amoebophrya sp. A25]|eukprot:GSA25T00000187001.1